MVNYFEAVLILIIAVVGFLAWKLYNDKKDSEEEVLKVEKEKDEYTALGQGLAEYNQKLQDKKDKIKAEIFELVKAGAKISNHDVAEKLGISRSSVKRYLDELEVENKIKQVGKSGRNVFYTLKEGEIT